MVEAFKKSDVEILLSTMNRDSLDFLVPMFPFAHFSDFNILIISQTTADKQLTSNYPTVRVINVIDKGLSKSRNLALQSAIKKIGFITDDDVVFTPDFDAKIIQGFNRFPDAAVVKFCAATFEGQLFRKYLKAPRRKVSAFQRVNTMSIEIGVNIARVKESGVVFNTLFGLGSFFPQGEEPIFVNEIYDSGYGVSFEPEVVATHKADKDSDAIPLSEIYRIRGAYYAHIFATTFVFWLGLQLMYHVKQGVVKPHKIVHYIQHALKGKQQLLSLSKNENKP